MSPDRDQVGGADDQQRQQRQERRPVDEQEQEQDQAEGRDQQRLAGVFGDLLEVGGDPARPGHVGVQAGMAMGGEVGADLLDARRTTAPRSSRVDRQRHQRRFAVARDRPDPARDPRHLAQRLLRLLREGGEDRRRPGEAEPFEPFAEPADRVQVGGAEPAVALEDDQHRHVIAALEVALEQIDDLGRLGVRGQVAALPRRGHLFDMSPGEQPGEAQHDPDGDGDPATARAGDARGKALDAHGGTLDGPVPASGAPYTPPERKRRTGTAGAQALAAGTACTIRFAEDLFCRRWLCEHTFPFDQRSCNAAIRRI